MDRGVSNTFRVKKWSWVGTLIVLYLIVSWIFGASFSWQVGGLILLCFLCELVDSSIGMGYGTTLTPILLVMGYEPLDLVPTILLSEFLSGFTASYFHHETGNVDFSRKTQDFRVALLLALGSVVGVAIGVNLALQIPTFYLKIVIGIIITIAGGSIWMVHKRQFVYKTWKMFVLASIAAFNKALSGGGYGPIMTSGQILSGIRSKASVGITSFAEGFTCLVGVILFLGRGQTLDLNLLLPVVLGALLSVPFSTEFVKRVDEKKFKKLIAGMTIILGLFTIVKTII